MTLRKITIDNSVRNVPKSEQTKEKENKQKKELVHSLVNKNKNISQNSKRFLKNVAASGFKYLK